MVPKKKNNAALTMDIKNGCGSVILAWFESTYFANQIFSMHVLMNLNLMLLKI